MYSRIKGTAISCGLVAVAIGTFGAGQSRAQGSDWRTPFPGHQVIGNLFAVGTAGLGDVRLLVHEQTGQPHSPETFVDPEGFYAEVERLERIYLDQVAAEQRSR